MKPFVRRLLAASLLALSLAAVAQAAVLSGVTMPDQLNAGGTTLVLNGLGMRKVTIIKVYVGGLYLPAKSHDSAAIMAADAPRAIRMEFVRDVDKGRLTGGFREGFEKNAGTKVASQKANFEKFLALVGDQKKGAVMTFTYVPGTGTAINIGGKDVATFEGKEFADALFSLWLGPVPPSGELRKGMLGL
jgi:hypothetical protein